MSFLNLKEFKEELSQAVNELVDEEKKPTDVAGVESEDVVVPDTIDIGDDEMINTLDEEPELDTSVEESLSYETNIDTKALDELLSNKDKNKKEEEIMDRLEQEVKNVEEVKNHKKASKEAAIASDEVAEITKGMSIEGNVNSDGSINVNGKVKGDICCNGKLVISGIVVGVSTASEIYTNNAKIKGDIVSEGSVKVGNSSIIVGNVYGTSAVVGGAIKGDLDIKGPVIVDGTAVVQGNIKSRSVQINNGAVIEGIISQCYADVDYEALFEKTFSE